jgi:hypothetical protein
MQANDESLFFRPMSTLNVLVAIKQHQVILTSGRPHGACPPLKLSSVFIVDQSRQR